MPRSLTLTPSERALRAQIRRDLRRGAVTGSRAYQRAMQEAQALYDRAVARDRAVPGPVDGTVVDVEAELDVTRRRADGTFLVRRDGTPYGLATRFKKAS